MKKRILMIEGIPSEIIQIDRSGRSLTRAVEMARPGNTAKGNPIIRIGRIIRIEKTDLFQTIEGADLEETLLQKTRTMKLR